MKAARSSFPQLTKREADIATCLQLFADRSLAEVERETGYRQHSIRYAVKNLLDRGVLRPYSFINIYPLGFVEHSVFCSITCRKPKERERFVSFIVNSPEVSWICEVGGDYQYGFSICSSRPEAVTTFLTKLSDEFGDIFAEKVIATCLRWSLFRRKYLSPVHTKINELRVGYLGTLETIDELDHQLLSALSRRAPLSLRDLARITAIPATTIDYRLGKLREKKVYFGTVYSIEPDHFGFQSFRVHVCLRGVGKSGRERLFEYAKHHPHVVSFVDWLGAWDISMRIEVPEAAAANEFQRDLYDRFPEAISLVRLFPISAEHKFANFPFSLKKTSANQT